MTKFIKVIAAVALAAIGQTLFAYNGGYENSLTTDTVIGGVTYKGYGNNTVTKRTESGTTIAANSYAQCSKLTSVNLAGVTSLGNAAFAYSALTSVELPATLTSIGYIPFGGCKSLASVTINSTAFMTSADEAKEPFRDCTALKTVTAKCAPPSWDFKKVFPAVTTVKVPQANLSAWQAKKYAGVTVSKFDENVYSIRFHQNASPWAATLQNFPVGVEKALPWITSGLGWVTPAGTTLLGWGVTATETIARYENAAKVKDLAAAGETFHLYAIWRPENSYVIKYCRNTTGDDAVSAWQYAVPGKSFTFPWIGSGFGWTAPAGYTFLGWAKTKGATKPDYDNHATVASLATKGATVTLYAVWKTPAPVSTTYSIRFHQNASPWAATLQNFPVGVEKALPWITAGLGWVTPADTTLLGWGMTATETIARYENAAKVKDLAAAGETFHLYAIWRPTNSYVIKYCRNTTDEDAVSAWQYAVPGKSFTFPWIGSGFGWTAPAGYTFLGWAKTKGATKPDYDNHATVASLAAKGATVTLYAVWKRPTYSIRFHQNVSPWAATLQNFNVGQTTALPWITSGLGWVTPAGTTLLGWGVTSTETIARYENAAKVKDLAAVGETFHLYAIWRPENSYVIKYCRNTTDEDAVSAWQYAVPGKSFTFPWIGSGFGWTAPAGYAFLGWAKTKGATKPDYDNHATVASLASAKNVTVELYAVWKKTAAAVFAPMTKSTSGASAATASATSVVDFEETFEPGYYRGEFADGSGTFDLVVDEDGAAFFRAETEDSDWSAECEAEAVGDALVLTFEDAAPLVIRWVEGQCRAEAAERCP